MNSPRKNIFDNFLHVILYGFKKWPVSIAVLFLAIFIFGAVTIHKIPYTYHSEFRILPIEDESLTVTDVTNPNLVSDLLFKKQDYDRDEHIYRILLSRTLIETVAAKLNMAEAGTKKMNKLVNSFFSSFYVFQKDTKSNTYRVSIKYFNPQIAYDFCLGIIEELSSKIKSEEAADKAGTITLLKNYMSQNQISKTSAQSAMSALSTAENRKALYDRNAFIRENFLESDFISLTKPALMDILKAKIESFSQIEHILNQQYQIVTLKEKSDAMVENKQYFSIVDKPDLLNFPDAPDKRLLYIILIFVSAIACIGYIYARIYVHESIGSLKV